MASTKQGERTLLDEFRWRGLIHITDKGEELVTPGLAESLAKNEITAYVGFDPSAESLHVGNLLSIMNLVRLQKSGHTPIAVAGGGTGLIGDPSGKADERALLTREQMAENLKGIRGQLERFMDFGAIKNAAKIVNNLDWLDAIGTLDFMRDIGKHFTINQMIAKESVQSRLQSGISFTEFSYMLLQAYDYLVLYDRHGCTLQMGGSDQWGNITAGIELIRRTRGAQAHALVTPLITNASGTKFGKTESGTVWLDAGWTSPYAYHQFWLNTPDADVIRYLKYFTLMTPEEIEEAEKAVAEQPEKREAQRRLADEVTLMTHGESELRKARRAGQVLFSGDVTGLSADELLEVFQDVPSSSLAREQLEGGGIPLADLVVSTGLAGSRGEARRLVQGGGVSVGGQRVSDARHAVTLEQAVEGRLLVLRRGAREYRLVLLEG